MKKNNHCKFIRSMRSIVKIGFIKQLVILVGLIGSSACLLGQTKALNDAAQKASVKRGEIIYKKVCLSCHMADGGGVPHLNPPLAQSSYVLGDKSKIIYIVLHGMTDRVPIEDEYYSNNMAPHSDLTNLEIADVLTYVRNSFGNNATAVSIADVKASRLNGVKKKK